MLYSVHTHHLCQACINQVFGQGPPGQETGICLVKLIQAGR